jgi:hypothetical protein
VQAIGLAAQELVTKRDAWLNPVPSGLGLGEAELKKRTLTNLYNARPTWLDLAHGLTKKRGSNKPVNLYLELAENNAVAAVLTVLTLCTK